MVVLAELVSHTGLTGVSATVLLSSLHSQFNTHESQSNLLTTSANCVLLCPQSSCGFSGPTAPGVLTAALKATGSQLWRRLRSYLQPLCSQNMATVASCSFLDHISALLPFLAYYFPNCLCGLLRSFDQVSAQTSCPRRLF